MDGTGSGSCAVVGFGISGVEPLCSATGSTNVPAYLPNCDLYNKNLIIKRCMRFPKACLILVVLSCRSKN